MEFSEFEALARERGGTARDCGGGHWQVRGLMLVNYYPFAKGGPTIYVAGTSRSVITGGPDAAVALAFKPPPRVRLEPRMKPHAAKAARKRLLAADPRCRWCQTVLTLETSTLDHVVPLGRGGTNRRDNLALACWTCNNARGCDMPELKDGRET